ncbi:hypothetical protein KSP40_PGU002019 [Platanthera guangdongensis]|uniref:Agenet domain-containing protein n=1 Tax=Platanthera guangdongensis TaxID=2320717 RepID=A0ABR2MX80_9ASPA
MDYDDNDFQSQNFHIVGEDKFSASLRSFALPKFELDEHLRFDSLVEEEVLLGIQGPENNWIDFPPGNSAIEFSSSAVESCSIARHKNVWYEATSSESVDLLLKSLGEDEMIDNKADIMETCANNESHGIDNQVDLSLEKSDDHKPHMMGILPVDPELTQDKLQENLSGSNGGHRTSPNNSHCLSQAAEREDSGIAIYVGHSDVKFNSDGEIGDNVIPFYSPIEKPTTDGDGLCEALLNRKGVCEVLMRPKAPSVGDSDSSVVDSQSLESNHDVKLVMENVKLSTRVFPGGQHQTCISKSSDFPCDVAHNEKSLVVDSDDMLNHQLVCTIDSVGPINKRSIYSVSENSDGLVVAIPYQTNIFNGTSEVCGDFSVKEGCMSRVAMTQEKNENNSVTISSKAMHKTTQLTDGYSSVSDRLPVDSVEDDDFHSIRTRLIKKSTLSCNDRGGKNDTCMDVIDNIQDSAGQPVENRSTDVKIGTKMLEESPSSAHILCEVQGTEIEERGGMSANSQSFTYEKSGLVFDGKPDSNMDVDRKEVKLYEDNGPHGESTLPVTLIDASSLPVLIDSDTMTSPSTYCKSVSKASVSIVDLTEVRMPEVHVSVDKVSSLASMDPCRIMSGPLSMSTKKVQDLPPTVQDGAGELSSDVSANKSVEEEFGSVISLPTFEKSGYLHLSTPENTTTIDLAVGKKEPLQILSPSCTNHEDVKVSCITASSLLATRLDSEKESVLASVSCPLNMKSTSLEKNLQDDSGNERKHSDGSMLSNSKKKVDIETANGAVSSSDCVDDAIANTSAEQLPNAVMQSPSPVQSAEYTPPQNGISHDPQKGKYDILNSEVVSHVTNEVSVSLETASGRYEEPMPPSVDHVFSCLTQSNEESDPYKFSERDVSYGQNLLALPSSDNLNSNMNDSSQRCTGTAAESSSSEAHVKTSSAEGNCSSPIVIDCKGCHADNSEYQEVKALGNMDLVSSDKYKLTHKADGSSNVLHDTSVEDRSFIFGVSTSKDLPERVTNCEISFPNLKAVDIPEMSKENAQGLSGEVKVFNNSTKTPNQGRPKNASRSFNEKKTGSKGKTKKEPRDPKPFVEIQEKSSTEPSSIKISPSLDAQTSSIPDLNSSSSLALFHHHFTDLQQVQLRAQIFVYGALISGMPPDEAYMVSAFGDGGRNSWDGIWHVSVEKFRNQKSPLGGYGTPLHSRAGSDFQSKVPTTSAKSGNTIISSSVPSSPVSLPSPLWSLSYGNDGHRASISRGTYMNFSQTPSPLPRQSPVSRQHVGANSSCLSQSPRHVPWYFSSQISALDGVPQYSTIPFTETTHIDPVRDSCGPHTATVEGVPHRGLMHAPDTTATTAAAVLQTETPKGAATSVNNNNTQTTQRARKKKKNMVAEELNLLASQTLAESVAVPNVFKSLSLPSSNLQLNVSSHAPDSISMPHIVSPTHYQMIYPNNNQQMTILYGETCNKLEQAKLQAEDATALAASTVKYSQSIWNQLAAHKNSGIVSHIEEKLASAAVAAAAAASVAKAAAAAANVSCAAALQAKIMADEAMSATKTVNTVLNPESDILDVGKKLAGISSISILKGMDKIHGSGAIISAASEASRRRVESASAATKRAENLDAIVKAAELVAEAVIQAGTIIAMGDPLPFTLSQLVDAGPEGFWRSHAGTSMKIFEPTDMHVEEHVGSGSTKVHGVFAKQLDDPFSKEKETRKAAGEGEPSSLKTCPEQFQGSAQGNFSSARPETDQHGAFSSIHKGSIVEVMSDKDGLRGAWFSAGVLDMDDNRAYVCYNDVSTAEGELKEWIVLEDGEKAPRIRIAHTIASVKNEGTRKRHREHPGSCIWEVGDHVDGWIHDRWWEGTITEKSSGDETKLTVHFPDRGDTQVVHTWNLRPSLIWKDGQWMERSHAKGKSFRPHEGDTPQVKRQKMGRFEANIYSEFDVTGTSKLSNNIMIEDSKKHGDSRSLFLSSKDRIFTVGRNPSEQITSNALKQKRTGLQKEGSRVVFGVPRPGKKRKFMEVSKHYVANKSEKIREGNDSLKFAKYLMPQASRQSRNTSKVDNKGGKAVQIKPKGGVKSVVSQSFQTRSVAVKDKASVTSSNEQSTRLYHKDVMSNFKGIKDSMDSFKFSSILNQTEKINVSAMESENSVQPAPPTLSKKKSTSGSEMDLAGKPTSSTDRASVIEDKVLGNPGKAVHEVMEPRRSNRRIQPTSRKICWLTCMLESGKSIPDVRTKGQLVIRVFLHTYPTSVIFLLCNLRTSSLTERLWQLLAHNGELHRIPAYSGE